MQKVVAVLLRSFLRRYPIPTRINLYSYLGRYAWLKDVLEELRPELFPPQRDLSEAATVEALPLKPDITILGILERSEIRGRLGYYKAETYLGQRGNGHLFGAVETTSKRPVTIKEFLLPVSNFTKAEALQQQNQFKRLAGIQLSDGRFQDFRVVQPFEAIADSESHERCFLVTEAHDQSPTLRHYLHRHKVLPLEQVREILSQILQSLDFLHKQKFSFPSDAIQNGLIHGNLNLDSVLWTEQQAHPFVYLCDLLLWEQCFDPVDKQKRSTQATTDSIQQDLRAVGDLGATLLQGLEPDDRIAIDPAFKYFLDALRTAKFDSAETARRELLRQVPRSPIVISALEDGTTPIPPSKRFSPLLLLGLLGLLVGAWMLFPRLRPTAARVSPTPQVSVSTCCLSEISGIPVGEFTYTSVQGGTWWTVLQQPHLLQPGQSLMEALAIAQPKLRLQYAPTRSLDQVLQQVRLGEVDFAVLPLIDELPGDLMAQEIAYDGLAAVVSFSYSERQQGLPTALKGQLTLEQVRKLYADQIDQWKSLGGPPLKAQRYASKNPEAIAIFEQRVLNSRSLQELPYVQSFPAIELLRQIIRDFEDRDIGSLGFTPLSEMSGQCSVYPLALSQAGKPAVQPLVLSNGQDISPETDLCARKGAYAPDPERFQTSAYPLSYPVLVVYPRDNRRSAIGKKFVELMRTIEGQRLLQSAGLVPLRQVRGERVRG